MNHEFTGAMMDGMPQIDQLANPFKDTVEKVGPLAFRPVEIGSAGGFGIVPGEGTKSFYNADKPAAQTLQLSPVQVSIAIARAAL